MKNELVKKIKKVLPSCIKVIGSIIIALFIIFILYVSSVEKQTNKQRSKSTIDFESKKQEVTLDSINSRDEWTIKYKGKYHVFTTHSEDYYLLFRYQLDETVYTNIVTHIDVISGNNTVYCVTYEKIN